MPRPRPSRLRRLRRLSLFLLLGLVTTVGVAWGLAATFKPGRYERDTYARSLTFGSKVSPTLEYVASGGFGSLWRAWDAQSKLDHMPSLAGGGVVPAIDSVWDSSVALWTWTPGGQASWGRFPTGVEAFKTTGEFRWGFEEAHGLPALALWDTPFIDQSTDPASSATHGFSETAPPPFGMTIPLRPIWPGLALNTAFYAMLWWLAFASLRMVKHNRRYRRGECPVCRYDLRADYSAGCSECGWDR